MIPTFANNNEMVPFLCFLGEVKRFITFNVKNVNDLM